MNRINLIIFPTLVGTLLLAAVAQAIPVLQVGASAGAGDVGIYADYVAGVNPEEQDTAFVSGDPSKLLVAGGYKDDSGETLWANIGGQYSGENEHGKLVYGKDWTNKGFVNDFAGVGAVLVATVADGTLNSASFNLSSLTVNGMQSFFQADTLSETGHSKIGSIGTHAPTNNQDYLFFDIGNFAYETLIPNFDTESTGSMMGEIKELSLSVDDAFYDWIHFDVFALITKIEIDGTYSTWGDWEIDEIEKTTIQTNPYSKDVTWTPTTPVPEPGTMLLFGTGLVGLATVARKKHQNE